MYDMPAVHHERAANAPLRAKPAAASRPESSLPFPRPLVLHAAGLVPQVELVMRPVVVREGEAPLVAEGSDDRSVPLILTIPSHPDALAHQVVWHDRSQSLRL